MSNSYDSVTPKRRPAIRVVLAISAIVAIFGASVGAAQQIDADPVNVVSAAATASLGVPSSADTSQAVTTTEAPVVTTTTTTTSLPEQAAPTEAAPVVNAAETAGGFGSFEVGGASDDGGQGALNGPSDEVLELIAKIEQRDQQIAVLSEQLAYLRQAQLLDQVAADHAATPSALTNNSRISPEQNAAAMDLWRAGYTLGGGKNLPAFENTILPCESGSQPNPDTAVGRTDDWGRSQINRPTWKKRFESLTGADFETNIVNPTLNGFMAAHVEQEQGLSAWTCWRKR